MVLGGTTPHIELINQLKDLGYFTILIDYLENPPAKEFADLHIRESTLDEKKVLKIVEEYHASLVISACIDQANSVCCYVSEKLNLPHPYSYETSILVTKKSKMKERMLACEIPSSWFYSGSDLSQIPWEMIEFPAVVKPVDCNSSKGVRKANSVFEAKLFFQDALQYSRSGEALIEGFVDGVEIQVDCFASEEKTHVVLVREKKTISRELVEEMNSEGSILPSPSSMGMEDFLESIGDKIAKAFNLRNTPFFYQAIVDKFLNVYVLEFAPRVGGGLSYYILKNLAGFDAVKAVINSYLHIETHFSKKRLEHLYSTNLLYMNEGIFDHIEGLGEAKKAGLILDFFVTKEKGTKIGNSLRSGNRVGAFVVEADSLEELWKKENQTYSHIEVIDADGKPQMKRWRDK